MGTVENAISEVISNAIRVESADITRFVSAIQEDIVIILNNKVLLLECLFRLFDLLHEGSFTCIIISEDYNILQLILLSLTRKG